MESKFKKGPNSNHHLVDMLIDLITKKGLLVVRFMLQAISFHLLISKFSNF